MTSHALNLILLITLATAAFVFYVKVYNAPAHTDPAIPIPYTSKEGNVMNPVMVAPAASVRSDIPPIDAAAPKTFETATFAMG